MVCFIHRPEYYKILEDERGQSLKGIAEIIIAKHRNGATGDVKLKFRSEYAKFTNVDEIDENVYYKEYSSSMNVVNNIPPPISSLESDFLQPAKPNETPF
jgi:replicative DNA helicase